MHFFLVARIFFLNAIFFLPQETFFSFLPQDFFVFFPCRKNAFFSRRNNFFLNAIFLLPQEFVFFLPQEFFPRRHCFLSARFFWQIFFNSKKKKLKKILEQEKNCLVPISIKNFLAVLSQQATFPITPALLGILSCELLPNDYNFGSWFVFHSRWWFLRHTIKSISIITA